MYKPLSLIAAVAVLTGISAAVADEEDLFSKFSSRSVFSEAGDSAEQESVVRRITSSKELRDLLKSVGFDAEVASRQAVTAEKELEPWTFPVLLVLSDDETSVTVALGLTTIKDVDKELPAKTLLELMTASQQHAPALFSYHAGRQRTELSYVIKNDNLTGQLLRDQVNRLAVLARSTSDIWADDSQKKNLKPIPKKEVTAPSSPNTSSLTGQWSAAKSDKEAFAIEFKADGKFNLVYINNGQQTRSSGRFTLQNGSLELAGADGLNLQGTLTMNSDREFRFDPQNAQALIFTKAPASSSGK